MTRVRKFFPDTRLRRMLNAPGGIRVSQALQQAQQEIAAIRDQYLPALDAKIDAIGTCAESGEEDQIRRCYKLANEIFAEAGAFGLNDLSAVCYNLCDLLNQETRAAVSQNIIKVHVDAMRALRTPQGEQAELRAAILDGLHRMRAQALR